MDTKFCSKCGAQLNADSAFCPSCGTPAQEPNGTATQVNIQQQSNCSRTQAPEKDKTAAALLAIFLGGLGIHYFYLGKTTAGILSLVITLCSCGIWQILMFAQGIYMLTLSQEVFTKKYIDNTATIPLF